MNKPGSGSKAAFVKGPSLVPKDKLVEWMEAQKVGGEGRLLRVPIVLTKGDRGWDTSKAKIGELEVHALDGSLGEGLADRADMDCPDGGSCGYLAEGYWLGKKTLGLTFDVKEAKHLPKDKLAAVTFAEVEGESGN